MIQIQNFKTILENYLLKSIVADIANFVKRFRTTAVHVWVIGY